jgi:hypothetical protein
MLYKVRLQSFLHTSSIHGKRCGNVSSLRVYE